MVVLNFSVALVNMTLLVKPGKIGFLYGKNLTLASQSSEKNSSLN